MQLAEREQLIKIFLADQAKAARHEAKVPYVLTLDHAPRFLTKREADQYNSACAQLRAVRSVIKHAQQRITDSAVETQAMLQDNGHLLSQDAQQALIQDHARYIEPILRSMECNEKRAQDLQGLIERLLGGAK